eukprot:768088-Hanusia_phi.AAC.7
METDGDKGRRAGNGRRDEKVCNGNKGRGVDCEGGKGKRDKGGEEWDRQGRGSGGEGGGERAYAHAPPRAPPQPAGRARELCRPPRSRLHLNELRRPLRPSEISDRCEREKGRKRKMRMRRGRGRGRGEAKGSEGARGNASEELLP